MLGYDFLYAPNKFAWIHSESESYLKISFAFVHYTENSDCD